MKKANKLEKANKNYSPNKDFNPEPVEIVWNKDSRKPTKQSPQDEF